MNLFISIEESKVMFALLDAADEQGVLRSSSVEGRWRDARSRLTNFSYEGESGLMWDLLLDLERAGALHDSWILDRWNAIKAQVRRSKDLADEAMELVSRHTPPLFAREYRN